jgi:hypothetical protein
MLSHDRVAALSMIDRGMTAIFQAGAEGSEADRESAIADLLFVARDCARSYSDLATIHREKASAEAVELAVSKAEDAITETSVGM